MLVSTLCFFATCPKGLRVLAWAVLRTAKTILSMVYPITYHECKQTLSMIYAFMCESVHVCFCIYVHGCLYFPPVLPALYLRIANKIFFGGFKRCPGCNDEERMHLRRVPRPVRGPHLKFPP